MKESTIRGIFAILVFTTCAWLLVSGIDGEVKAFMGFVLGYYFHSAQYYLKNKKDNDRRITSSNS